MLLSSNNNVVFELFYTVEQIIAGDVELIVLIVAVAVNAVVVVVAIFSGKH